MVKAFAYLRVSGKGQLDGDGFARQAEAIRAYARTNDMEIVEWFEERGVCGDTEWTEREAWGRMIASLNGVRTILVEKLDRLARDLMVQEYIVKDLKEREVVLHSADGQQSDTTDPMRIMMRQILGAFAAYEKAMIVLKLSGARKRVKAATGRCEGRKPYGVNAEELQTLDMMKVWQRAGFSIEEISRQLNKRGIAPRSGKKWYGSSVSNILGREK